MENDQKLPVTYVDSGKYVVGSSADRILGACLGSCVGVSLYDRLMQVGGLYHILLAEPHGTVESWREACYATTGLPKFIEALCAEGARMQSLEAIVGGGALIGPLSERDFNLDIGGRTIETVLKLLGAAGIPVVHSETGGFFGSRMMLNLRTFSTQIEPIGLPVLEEADSESMAIDDVDEVIRRVKPIPQVALKLIRMINSKDYDIVEITNTVTNDQVISARVISLCNSAIFGLPTRVDSVQRALVLLGEKQLLHIALLASVQPYFSEENNGYSLCKGGLFHHGLRTAMIASCLADQFGCVEVDTAYTAGLLHDIGKTALDQYIAQAYPLFYRDVQEKARDMLTMEKSILGTNHAAVGRRLAEMWSLPEALIDCIAHHHDPQQATVSPDLTSLVYLSDLIVSLFQTGEELERMDVNHLGPSLEHFGQKRSDWFNIIDNIPQGVFMHSMLF